MSWVTWPVSHSWAFFKNALVADDRDDLGGGGVVARDQVVQRGEVSRARQANQRADQHGQPEPRLS